MKYVLTSLLLLLNLSACSDRPARQGEIPASPAEKSTSIVGGTEAVTNDKHIQHTVLITGKYTDGRFYNCTGTLIEKDIILTAAHCIGEPDSMKITFGNDPVRSGAIEILRAKRVLPHDKFGKSTEERNDIALIQLEGNAPLNFVPATLPWNSQQKIKEYKMVRVYGYGVTSGVLHEGRLDSNTVGTLRSTRLKILETPTGADIFVADQREGRGICAGDSGGPAFIHSSIIVGVISRGITDNPDLPQDADDDVCNYQSVFTRVEHYQTWITDGVKALRAGHDFTDLILQGP